MSEYSVGYDPAKGDDVSVLTITENIDGEHHLVGSFEGELAEILDKLISSNQWHDKMAEEITRRIVKKHDLTTFVAMDIMVGFKELK